MHKCLHRSQSNFFGAGPFFSNAIGAQYSKNKGEGSGNETRLVRVHVSRGISSYIHSTPPGLAPRFQQSGQPGGGWLTGFVLKHACPPSVLMPAPPILSVWHCVASCDRGRGHCARPCVRMRTSAHWQRAFSEPPLEKSWLRI